MPKLTIKPKPNLGTLVQGFSMSPAQAKKVERLAKHHGVSKSEIVRAMIDATDMPTKEKK